MTQTAYSPISPGTRIRTTQEDPSNVDTWAEEAKQSRKWGMKGVVVTHHDSHGLCYDVEHDDGTKGCYDPTEIETVSPEEIEDEDHIRHSNYVMDTGAFD